MKKSIETQYVENAPKGMNSVISGSEYSREVYYTSTSNIRSISDIKKIVKQQEIIRFLENELADLRVNKK